jgi:hypothetical protein
MSAAPASVIDILNGLLEAEVNSVFRIMESGHPYLDRASAEIRRPLQEMVAASHRRATELADLIDSLGGSPVPRSVAPEEQYLAYLSLKFLLPRLVSAMELKIRRYENAINALNGAPREVTDLLNAHLLQHQQQLHVLQKAAELVAKTR